jgi:hypothetical protein
MKSLYENKVYLAMTSKWLDYNNKIGYRIEILIDIEGIIL